MAEHWCKEHQQEFKRKGKDGKFWYSHPVVDEDGEPTGAWCNEPKDDSPAKTSPPSGGEMSKEEWAERERWTRKSIERQKALDVAKDWSIAKLNAGDKVTSYTVLTVAKLFESYIENGVVVKDKEP